MCIGCRKTLFWWLEFFVVVIVFESEKNCIATLCIFSLIIVKSLKLHGRRCKVVIYNYVFMLALFHDKKCCNCFNLVPCILWDFIVLGLVLSWWRIKLKWRISGFHKKLARSKPAKEPCEEHMTRSWRVVPGCRFRKCLAGKAFLRSSCETFFLEDF